MAIFEFIPCTDSQIIPVDISGTPIVGEVYLATGETGQVICGVIGDSTIGTPQYTATTLFDSCYDCLNAITPSLTANTIYEMCVTCSGDTYTVEVPHPVWTGLYGESIMQGNAVELGGRNGLNS
jgi:hypothetical protein